MGEYSLPACYIALDGAEGDITSGQAISSHLPCLENK